MEPPTINEIAETRDRLAPLVRRTPCLMLPPKDGKAALGLEAELTFKLELLQVTGTFKARGALSSMLALSPEALRQGVTAVSAGNHGIAVAYAAQALGSNARVVMIKTSNPIRVRMAREFGADVELAEDGPSAFRRVQEIAETEGRTFIHPFEGANVVRGTATLGLEWLDQAPDLEIVVVAVGGGGLIAGVASAMKQLRPTIRVFGVEPEGAAVVSASLRAGSPQTMPKVSTIADSLAPPMTTPYTFELCRQYVDRVVLVSDAAMRSAMATLFAALKLAVEPAGAAALAAALGPLHADLKGRRVGILICGANIDLDSFALLARTQ
jgi:threonine dehydratase